MSLGVHLKVPDTESGIQDHSEWPISILGESNNLDRCLDLIVIKIAL